jgi:hypothetical protein
VINPRHVFANCAITSRNFLVEEFQFVRQSEGVRPNPGYYWSAAVMIVRAVQCHERGSAFREHAVDKTLHRLFDL